MARSLSSADIDQGSKIENRKDGIFVIGVLRKDPLVLFNTVDFTTTTVGNTIWNIDSYTTLEDLKNDGVIDSYSTDASESLFGNSARSVASSSARSSSGTVYVRIDGVDYKLSFSAQDLINAGYVMSDLDYYISVVACQNLKNSGLIKSRKVGVAGIGCKPTIYNEKTATFIHINPDNDTDYAASAEIITPNY